MFSNYFFLKKLATALKFEIVGLTIVECFSQNKDELMVGLADKDKEFWIRANLDPNISVISFPDSVARARKNSVNLFEHLVGKKAVDCSIFKFERSFKIILENDFSLIFKMHGRRANILAAHKNNIEEIFRNSLKSDLSITVDSLTKDIQINKEAFFEYSCRPIDLIPALGKDIQTYWERNFSTLDDDEKWIQFKQFLDQLDTNPIFLDEESGTFSLLPITDAKTTLDAVDAANWLYARKTRGFYFDHEKAQLKSQLSQLIKKSENYIFKTSEKLRLVESQRNPEELANIIMANLSLIEKGLSKVVLNDFYTNEFVEIRLNPKLSPQKNAENFYRKSKNRHQEISTFEKNIEEKKVKIKMLGQQIEILDTIGNSKELKKFLKANRLEKFSGKTEESKPYHEFEKDSWRVLVGKNAKANDELTLKVASKNDLWLHAKDVSGSHVIIKEKPGQNFPQSIIEYAAALAAYNSKRKTDSLCPVIFTKKKFVRKPKGARPGSVVVEKEEVVMVEPSAG